MGHGAAQEWSRYDIESAFLKLCWPTLRGEASRRGRQDSDLRACIVD